LLGGGKEPEALVFGAELRCQYGSTHNYLLTEDYVSKGINGLPASFVVTDCRPIINIMPFGDCYAGGSCASQWMLNDKWINSDGQNETFGGKEIITTASHLVCNMCGMFILPVNSGQNSDIGKQLMLLAELDSELLGFLMNPHNSIYTPIDKSQQVLDMLDHIVNSDLYGGSIFLMAQGGHDIMGPIILASIGHLAPYIDVGKQDSLLSGMENMITRTGIKTNADPRNLDAEILAIMKADSKSYAADVAKGGFYKWQEEHKALLSFLADAVNTAAYAAIMYASMTGQQRNQGNSNSSYERDIRDAEIGQSNRMNSGNALPEDYLNNALKAQNLETPPNFLKETWTAGGYKYEVRIHPGDSQYTNAQTVYRVSKQQVPVPGTQGAGTYYLGTDGSWYHTSELVQYHGNGLPNPLYNPNAAQITHIPIK